MDFNCGCGRSVSVDLRTGFLRPHDCDSIQVKFSEKETLNDVDNDDSHRITGFLKLDGLENGKTYRVKIENDQLTEFREMNYTTQKQNKTPNNPTNAAPTYGTVIDVHRSMFRTSYNRPKQWRNRGLWLGVWGTFALLLSLTIIGIPAAAVVIVCLAERNARHTAWLEANTQS